MRKVMVGLAGAAVTAALLVVVAPDRGSPRELTVSVGDEVTWTHRDGEQVHSVTAEDGSFDSNPLCSAGNPKESMSDHDTFKHTFGAEGRFPYFSKTNGGPGGQGASGAIVVVTAPPPAPKKGAPSTTTTSTAPAGATTTTTAATTAKKT